MAAKHEIANSGPRRATHDFTEEFGRVVVAARLRAGLTQAELGAKTGTTQSAIARLEGGSIIPTVETLRRLANALGVQFEVAPVTGLSAKRFDQCGPTLAEIRARRKAILRIAAAHGASNVRLFGSVARGEAGAQSDVDVLVDLATDAQGFAYFGVLEDLRRALSEALGRAVDVVDSAALRDMRERVLGEAVPL